MNHHQLAWWCSDLPTKTNRSTCFFYGKNEKRSTLTATWISNAKSHCLWASYDSCSCVATNPNSHASLSCCSNANTTKITIHSFIHSFICKSFAIRLQLNCELNWIHENGIQLAPSSSNISNINNINNPKWLVCCCWGGGWFLGSWDHFIDKNGEWRQLKSRGFAWAKSSARQHVTVVCSNLLRVVATCDLQRKTCPETHTHKVRASPNKSNGKMKSCACIQWEHVNQWSTVTRNATITHTHTHKHTGHWPAMAFNGKSVSDLNSDFDADLNADTTLFVAILARNFRLERTKHWLPLSFGRVNGQWSMLMCLYVSMFVSLCDRRISKQQVGSCCLSSFVCSIQNELFMRENTHTHTHTLNWASRMVKIQTMQLASWPLIWLIKSRAKLQKWAS